MTINTERLGQYATLLRVRRRGRRRDAQVAGIAFLVSALLTIGSGLLNVQPNRSFYLSLGLLIAFGLSYLMAWARLEMINTLLEMLTYLEGEK